MVRDRFTRTRPAAGALPWWRSIGKRKVARCSSRQAASDQLPKFLADREEGRLVTGPRLTVAKRWLDEVVKPNPSSACFEGSARPRSLAAKRPF
jgi:hypothetical protein